MAAPREQGDRRNSGLRTTFISASNLVAAKLATGRPQDIVDVDAIRKAVASRVTRSAKKKIRRPSDPQWWSFHSSKLSSFSFAPARSAAYKVPNKCSKHKRKSAAPVSPASAPRGRRLALSLRRGASRFIGRREPARGRPGACCLGLHFKVSLQAAGSLATRPAPPASAAITAALVPRRGHGPPTGMCVALRACFDNTRLRDGARLHKKGPSNLTPGRHNVPF